MEKGKALSWLAVLIFLSAAFLTMLIPIMSTVCTGGESGLIPVRCMNLPRFSPFGIAAVAAPFILSVIYAIPFDKKAKKVLSVSVLGTDIICTAISMRSAYLWLEEIGDTGVKYHLSGFASIVLATAITVIICGENME